VIKTKNLWEFTETIVAAFDVEFLQAHVKIRFELVEFGMRGMVLSMCGLGGSISGSGGGVGRRRRMILSMCGLGGSIGGSGGLGGLVSKCMYLSVKGTELFKTKRGFRLL